MMDTLQKMLRGTPPTSPVTPKTTPLKEPEKKKIQQSVSSFWKQWRKEHRESVVQVINYAGQWNPIAPYRPPAEGGSKGTAFFIDACHLLTNAHVVIDALGGRQVVVRPDSGRTHEWRATILSVCPSKDIALLRLTPESMAKIKMDGLLIKPLVLGDDACVGQLENVMAVGFPLGQEGIKYTTGEVSGYHQENNMSYIQISAPINGGNSGGPLINEAGEVIGINAAGYLMSQSVGYAIPTRAVTSVLHTLFATPYRQVSQSEKERRAQIKKTRVWMQEYPPNKPALMEDKLRGQKLVAVPKLKVKLQRTNRLMLEEVGISLRAQDGYKGGMYAYEWINKEIKPAEVELKKGDLLVALECPDPFVNKEFKVKDFYHPLTDAEGLQKQRLSRAARKSWEENVKNTCSTMGEAYYDSVSAFMNRFYDSGNFFEGKAKYPRLKVQFKPNDSALEMFRRNSDLETDKWEPTSLTKNRKLGLSEFLDMLPTGIPLRIVFYRGKTPASAKPNEIQNPRSYWTRFLPCLVADEMTTKDEQRGASGEGGGSGVKHLYPNYERPEYEILFGMNFMPLLANHIDTCNPGLSIYLRPSRRNKSWVVVTQVFPDTDVFDTQEIRAGVILEYLTAAEGDNVLVPATRIRTVEQMRNVVYDIAQKAQNKTTRITLQFSNHKVIILNFWQVIAQDFKTQLRRNIVHTPFFDALRKKLGMYTQRDLTSSPPSSDLLAQQTLMQLGGMTTRGKGEREGETGETGERSEQPEKEVQSLQLESSSKWTN